jgi:hypothetical protein
MLILLLGVFTFSFLGLFNYLFIVEVLEAEPDHQDFKGTSSDYHNVHRGHIDAMEE